MAFLALISLPSAAYDFAAYSVNDSYFAEPVFEIQLTLEGNSRYLGVEYIDAGGINLSVPLMVRIELEQYDCSYNITDTGEILYMPDITLPECESHNWGCWSPSLGGYIGKCPQPGEISSVMYGGENLSRPDDIRRCLVMQPVAKVGKAEPVGFPVWRINASITSGNETRTVLLDENETGEDFTVGTALVTNSVFAPNACPTAPRIAAIRDYSGNNFRFVEYDDYEDYAANQFNVPPGTSERSFEQAEAWSFDMNRRFIWLDDGMSGYYGTCQNQFIRNGMHVADAKYVCSPYYSFHPTVKLRLRADWVLHGCRKTDCSLSGPLGYRPLRKSLCHTMPSLCW